MLRRLIRTMLWLTAIALLVLVCGAFVTYRATQQTPEFYVRVLNENRDSQKAAGEVLERNVEQLQKAVLEQERWDATFTESQVNGWLAVDLPNEYPDALPASIREPRVSITPDGIEIGCRFESERFSTVVSMSVKVQLTDERNTVELQLERVRMGRVPVPIKQVTDELVKSKDISKLPVRWNLEDGQHSAFLTIPVKLSKRPKHEVQIDKVELQDGAIHLSGRTVAM